MPNCKTKYNLIISAHSLMFLHREKTQKNLYCFYFCTEINEGKALPFSMLFNQNIDTFICEMASIDEESVKTTINDILG